ncbi:hypothetical protein SAMN02982929_00902 [Saccharopolyspora kobensis]|uniref:DUF2383 domain-containing protein n=1 Tax=Saccharopolyspora kobensis TaxID=146035 RepID=A0A1H5VJT9_9PSEU|nr:hypothetical protein SAMN02982929_00902 [Saccharopolyspora kobensis]SFC60091.1 hypothetical protein SAMN05216506_1011168 [Saccharopolyspora kobensis]
MDAPSSQRMLEIYLNDHLAAATGGVALARRATRNNRDAAITPRLAAVAREIEQDRRSLLAIMRKLDVQVARYKVAMGWAGEKAGRLKLNGGLVNRTPLSDLIELEALVLGVQGKAAGWRTLLTIAEREPRVNTDMLRNLLTRAQQQFDELESIRVQIASEMTT